MGRATRLPEPKDRVTLDGVEYAWECRHAWFHEWDTGQKKISVSVAIKPRKTRELILDLSFAGFGPERNPPPSKLDRAVASGIRLAIEAGWEPESRGKAFRYDLSVGMEQRG